MVFKRRRFTRRRKFAHRKKASFGKKEMGILTKDTRVTLNAFKTIEAFAPRYLCRMTYVDTYKLTASVAGTCIEDSYRTNTPFDPYSTGGGHSAYGYGTMKTIYSRYRVWGMKYQVTVVPDLATANYSSPTTVCVLPTANAFSGNILNVVCEKPRARVKICNIGQEVVLKGTIWNPALNGQTNQQYIDDDNTQALTGANPNSALFFQLFMGNADAASTATATVTYKLDYFVEWFDPIMLGQSSG